MKILISGHNGFIGKHLIRKLRCLKSKYEIDFLTKSNFQSVDLSSKISPNDIIFHFAAQAGVRYSVVNPKKYIESN